MKVLSEGNLPTPGAWWDGYQASCPVCKARVELEGADKPVAETHESGNEVLFACPMQDCTGKLTVRKS